MLLPICLALALSAAPGRPEAASEPNQRPDPAVAAWASGLATPVFAFAVGLGFYTYGELAYGPGRGVELVVPLAIPLYLASSMLTGTGQFYAGDRERATWVGLGAPVSMVGGAAGGFIVALGLQSLYPSTPQMSRPIEGQFFLGALGALVAVTGYSMWSAKDAYDTTIRLNQQLAP